VVCAGLDNKLVAEVVKSYGLEKELSEVKGSLQKESDEHDDLHVVIELVYDDLGVTPQRRRARLRSAPFGSWSSYVR
jgi:hypothetical protein